MRTARYCGGASIGLRQWLGASPTSHKSRPLIPSFSPRGGEGRDEGDSAGFLDAIRERQLASPAPEPWSSWPQLRGRTVIETYRGRTAIALACRLLGLGPGDEILVPAYNCGTEIDALLASGATVTAYRVSRKCEIDFQHLFSLLSSRTRSVYLIHYFGWEQPMAELRKWCDEHGLLLIEDCALALFSAGQTGTIGRTGDAAIYSLPKTLGCAHGGLLSLASSPRIESQEAVPAGFSTLCWELRQSAKASALAGLDHLGLYGLLLALRNHLRGTRIVVETGEDFPNMPASYYFNPAADANHALHPWLRAAVGLLPWEEYARIRRVNYLWLAARLKELWEVQPLQEHLPSGVCPLSLPLVASNRDACVKALQARGIEAPLWWSGFHRSAFDWSGFPDACWLKRNVLTLPVHQGLKKQHLTRISDSFAQVLTFTGIGGSIACS